MRTNEQPSTLHDAHHTTLPHAHYGRWTSTSSYLPACVAARCSLGARSNCEGKPLTPPPRAWQAGVSTPLFRCLHTHGRALAAGNKLGDVGHEHPQRTLPGACGNSARRKELRTAGRERHALTHLVTPARSFAFREPPTATSRWWPLPTTHFVPSHFATPPRCASGKNRSRRACYYCLKQRLRNMAVPGMTRGGLPPLGGGRAA